MTLHKLLIRIRLSIDLLLSSSLVLFHLFLKAFYVDHLIEEFFI